MLLDGLFHGNIGENLEADAKPYPQNYRPCDIHAVQHGQPGEPGTERSSAAADAQEKLLRLQLQIALYTIRSERVLMG